MSRDDSGFFAGCALVAIIWIFSSTADSRDISIEKIKWAQQVCTDNEGLHAVDGENAFCVNGAEFTYDSVAKQTMRSN